MNIILGKATEIKNNPFFNQIGDKKVPLKGSCKNIELFYFYQL